ncbi:MAG: glycosyltransferase [Sphingobacteriales bacterium]|nr:MAG: glycosyltransferase [Sphingobacteriales bacterium]
MKPKLLIFINTLSFGGAERVVSQLLNNLTNEFELHLALYNKVIDYPIPPQVNIVDLQEDTNAGNMAVLLKIPSNARKLAAYCKQHNIYISVSFLNRPCYVNALMKAWYGFKGRVIMCERSHQSTILNYIGGGSTLYKIITKKLISYSYKKADLILTNSKVSKQDLIENFGIKNPINVIYNPIDILVVDKMATAPVHGIFDDGIFYFIATGNFRIEKNFPLLIEAFARLKNLPVKLVLVGGGAQETLLKEQVDHYEILDKVVFTGFDKNPFRFMKASHCFVLSSYTEGFPNVLLEALACGKPIISTDCKSGPRELLAPGSPINTQVTSDYELGGFGLLTPVNDATSLAKAMMRMYEDKDLQNSLAQKARQRATEFDIAVIKNLFIEAFAGVPVSTPH